MFDSAPPGAERAWRLGMIAFAGPWARGTTAERARAARRALERAGASPEVVRWLFGEGPETTLSGGLPLDF